MKYLSATQAGRVIGVNEKTIRLWIAQGKLSAHHASKNRLAIPESEVERLARERSQYDAELVSLPALAHQVKQLQATVEELQAEIERLKSTPTPAPALPSTSLWQDAHAPTSAARPTRPARRQSTHSEPLPPGAILAREFAEAHGVNPYTFRDHITKGIRGDILHVSERPKAGRPKETERYLLPEQQAEAFGFWRRHDVPFTEQKGRADND